MQRIVCRLKQEVFPSKESNRAVYTIEVLGCDGHIPSIPVLFTQKDDAQKLMSLCNKYDISPIHILDIMEELLYNIEKKI